MITKGKRKFFRYCKYCGVIIFNDKGYKATVCQECERRNREEVKIKGGFRLAQLKRFQ